MEINQSPSPANTENKCKITKNIHQPISKQRHELLKHQNIKTSRQHLQDSKKKLPNQTEIIITSYLLHPIKYRWSHLLPLNYPILSPY